METHVKALGRLNILYGLAGGLAALLTLLLSGGVRDLFAQFDDPMMGIITMALLVLHLATALPSIIGGIFVMRYHSWARVLLIVVSALDCLTIPFGTLLGLYGLWVLLTPEVEPLFAEMPPHHLPRAAATRQPPGNRIAKSPLERATGD